MYSVELWNIFVYHKINFRSHARRAKQTGEAGHLLITTTASTQLVSEKRAGLKDQMRWSLYVKGLWIAMMPADHAWRTITGVDEMKWSEMNEMSVEK